MSIWADIVVSDGHRYARMSMAPELLLDTGCTAVVADALLRNAERYNVDMKWPTWQARLVDSADYELGEDA